VSTHRDCSGDPIELDARRITQQGLGRQTEGSDVKNSRVVELHDPNHYVFIVDEALVVRETRKFLLDE
jgi:hypothetical protein